MNWTTILSISLATTAGFAVAGFIVNNHSLPLLLAVFIVALLANIFVQWVMKLGKNARERS